MPERKTYGLENIVLVGIRYQHRPYDRPVGRGSHGKAVSSPLRPLQVFALKAQTSAHS
jgi:hypothetical protein